MQWAEPLGCRNNPLRAFPGGTPDPMFSFQKVCGLLRHVSTAKRSFGGICFAFDERATDVRLRDEDSIRLRYPPETSPGAQPAARAYSPLNH